MPTPQGWEEIMPTCCRCKNPPIHKPHDVHRVFFFFFFFFFFIFVIQLNWHLFLKQFSQSLGFLHIFGYILEPNREIWPCDPGYHQKGMRKTKMCRFGSGNWFCSCIFAHFANAGKWHSKRVYLLEKSVITIMMCSLFLIGQGGLLLVVSQLVLVSISVLWVGLGF